MRDVIELVKWPVRYVTCVAKRREDTREDELAILEGIDCDDHEDDHEDHRHQGWYEPQKAIYVEVPIGTVPDS